MRARGVREGQTLVGLLIVALIIIGIIIWFWGFGGGRSSSPSRSSPPAPSTIHAVRRSAESVQCRTNLAQIRQAIVMFQTDSGRNPQSLSELRLPPQMLRCPVSGQPYQYDPRTGRVWCPTHPNY